jgi:hypothetical protein
MLSLAVYSKGMGKVAWELTGPLLDWITFEMLYYLRIP